MEKNLPFLLQDFMPYLLNRAAEATSLEFQKYYKARYGMLRTEWRVLFHLGSYGNMTAKDVCNRAKIHKTKVSRAVLALETRRFLTRENMENDRRHEILSLTPLGRGAFRDLLGKAESYNARIRSEFTAEEYEIARRFLMRLARTI